MREADDCGVDYCFHLQVRLTVMNLTGIYPSSVISIGSAHVTSAGVLMFNKCGT